MKDLENRITEKVPMRCISSLQIYIVTIRNDGLFNNGDHTIMISEMYQLVVLKYILVSFNF